MADDLSRSIPEPLRSGPVLIGLFAVLAVVSTGATVLLLGGETSDLIWAFGGGIGTAILILGTYSLGRRAGQPHSHAIAGASIIFGVLLLAAVVAELLHSSGTISDMQIAVGLGGGVIAAVVILGLISVADRATAV